MRYRITWIAGTILAGAVVLAASAPVTAQRMGPGMGQGPSDTGQGQMMQRRSGQMGGPMRGQMGGPMMGQMGGAMMGPMGGPMMGQMSGGMMGPRMRGGDSGTLFGMRVFPRMNLSEDDVRYHLDQRLQRLGNARLKLGEIKKKDDTTITADVVTKDDSLVQRLEVDRNTGAITYVQ